MCTLQCLHMLPLHMKKACSFSLQAFSVTEEGGIDPAA
jgi:hypothetical protein